MGFAARLAEEDAFLNGVLITATGGGALSKVFKVALVTITSALFLIALYLFLRPAAYDLSLLSPTPTIGFDTVKENTFREELAFDAIQEDPTADYPTLENDDASTANRDTVKQENPTQNQPSLDKAQTSSPVETPLAVKQVVSLSPEEKTERSLPKSKLLDSTEVEDSVTSDQTREQKENSRVEIAEETPAQPIRSAAPRINESKINGRWQQVLKTAKMRPNRLNKFYEDRQREVDAQLNAYNSTGIKPPRWGPGSMAGPADYRRQDLISEAYLLASYLRKHSQYGNMYDEQLRVFAGKVAGSGGSPRSQLEILRSLNNFPGLTSSEEDYVREHTLYLQAAYCILYGEAEAGGQLLRQLKTDGNFLFPHRLEVLRLQQ